MRIALLILIGLVIGCTALQRGNRSGTNHFEAEVERVLENAESLELLSLEPSFSEQEDSGFHGAKILGRVDFESRRDRSKIVAAIQKGIAESDGSSALCFIPRHGIRATRGAKSVDLVICYQCLQIQVHFENHTSSLTTTRHGKEMLNELLTGAGVPLAKE